MTLTAYESIASVRDEIEALYDARGYIGYFTPEEKDRYDALLEEERSLLGRQDQFLTCSALSRR